MKVSASALRVSNHNNWPTIELFPCEKEFVELLAKKNVQQIFVTAALVADDADEDFNSTVGHILDCLDVLPMRPDAGFDALYKTIDQGLAHFQKPNISRTRVLVDELFAKHEREWSRVTEILCQSMPQQTADYMAARILECWVHANIRETGNIKDRVNRSFGRKRYDEVRDKYLTPDLQNPGYFQLAYDGRRNAGRFLRLLFRSTTQQPQRIQQKSAKYPTLDLSDPDNLLTAKSKLECLLDICLATYRHERFHGEAFSPFRSSKAKLKTYAHAYYLLMISYVLSLGIMELKSQGGLAIDQIECVANRFAVLFASFFEDSQED